MRLYGTAASPMARQVTRASRALVLYGALCTTPWQSADAADNPATASATSAFHAGVYRGTLGGKNVQAIIDVEAGAEQSLTGTYFVFGEGTTVLLAGEFENDDLYLEESRDGKNVSGVWNGKIRGEHLVGTWSEDGDKAEVPFDLTRVGAIPNSR
jgi:hypothetical protein